MKKFGSKIFLAYVKSRFFSSNIFRRRSFQFFHLKNIRPVYYTAVSKLASEDCYSESSKYWVISDLIKNRHFLELATESWSKMALPLREPIPLKLSMRSFSRWYRWKEHHWNILIHEKILDHHIGIFVWPQVSNKLFFWMCVFGFDVGVR